jgi:hypothetical protein
LPDGVEMLALQYDVGRPRYALSDPELEALLDIRELLSCSIGWAGSNTDDDKFGKRTYTVFGPADHHVLRVNVVAESATLDKWAGVDNKGLLGLLKLRWRGLLALTHAKRLTTTYTDESDNIDWFESDKYYPPGWDEPFAERLKVITASDADFEQVRHLAENCDGYSKTISEVLKRAVSTELSRPPEFLVQGLMGKQIVTLVAGAKAAGKSSLLTSLAAACARRDSEWLGMPLNASKGQAVFLSGEDPADAVYERVKAMCGSVPPLLWVIHGESLADAFEGIGARPVNCLVIDPARKFLDGNEDDSGPVSKFFDEVTTFICAKGCPGVVAHHLRRGSAPRSLRNIPGLIRGSQVWLDRPRAILGLVRRTGVFGITSFDNIPQHNLGPGAMEKPITLAYDRETHRHSLREGDAPADEQKADDIESRVLAAASRLLDEGQRLTRGDKHELFAQKAPELTGLSRAEVRNAVDSLIAQELLARDADGVLALKDE